MNKIKLAVIFGGKSSEYSVSLHSASSAIENLDRNLYELIFIGIDESGKWYYYPGDVEGIEHDTWKKHEGLCNVVLSSSEAYKGFIKLKEDGCFELLAVDCIFPILHGKNGEDGTIQGLFALANIPFVGCDHLSSAISMDKDYTHIICEAANIKMAPYLCVKKSADLDYSALFKEVETKLTFPVFIKPANAGSSYGISKINTYDEFEEGLKKAFLHDQKVILETGIDGFEIGCAVLGNDTLTIGELDEIDTHNDFFDFEAKYALENTQIHCPARISETLTLEAKEMAKKIYRALGCSGLARVDMFVSTQGEIFFNEVNTIPGFTKASRYPTMMKTAGVDFKTLLNQLVKLAMDKACGENHATK
ncbi:MAG: D-alanine--D-alanine ligase [Erysipelotrichia bacterium]|nr:D-alanine--D-alanine ligase [Erysipelotrichia bacterium]NCC55149.1 D-alanine--D-alanine ligase [Erysipelotrichia bacterium]